MPRTTKPPAYRLYKRTGQAVVTLGGRDYYLGPHGTKVSRDEYDRLVGEWLTNGRQLHTNADGYLTIADQLQDVAPDDWTAEQIKRQIRTTGRCLVEVY